MNAKLTLPKIDAKIAKAFHVNLAQWYAANKRDLPWRHNPTAYHVTLSEFMCQQTQIATVLPYYSRWLKSFPDWQTLANSHEDRVLKHWEGLGYYNRARNLHKLAKVITRDFNGLLPADCLALQKLPGIGPYTAGAIASIVFNLPAAVLDGNVERVLTRVFALPWNIGQSPTKKTLWQLATALLPIKHFGDHNQSLMELGALICTPRSPHCSVCPLVSICQAKNNPEQFPHKTKIITIREHQQIAILTHHQKIWLITPTQPGRWQGFYRLPIFDTKLMITTAEQPSTTITFSITKYRIKADAYPAKFKKNAPNEGTWLKLSDLSHINLPAPHRKILQSLTLSH